MPYSHYPAPLNSHKRPVYQHFGTVSSVRWYFFVFRNSVGNNFFYLILLKRLHYLPHPQKKTFQTTNFFTSVIGSLLGRGRNLSKKRVAFCEYKHVGIWHCVFCMPIPLRVCLAKALTKRKLFLINPKTYQFLFFFCCRAVMRMTRLCGRTLLIKASTFILFFGTITIFRFSILRIA